MEGHTDSDSDAAYNVDLSARRAAGIMRYPVEAGGIDGGRLIRKRFDPNQPFPTHETRTVKDSNRCVDLTIGQFRRVPWIDREPKDSLPTPED